MRSPGGGHGRRRGGAVLVPEVMRPQNAARIADEGATVVRVDGGYGDAVRSAAEFAGHQPGRALVQDTAWPGYEQVPAWIVQGYRTLLEEADSQRCRQRSGRAARRGGSRPARHLLRPERGHDPGRVVSCPDRPRAALGLAGDVVVLLSTEGPTP